jgi:hypothetical protein
VVERKRRDIVKQVLEVDDEADLHGEIPEAGTDGGVAGDLERVVVRLDGSRAKGVGRMR